MITEENAVVSGENDGFKVVLGNHVLDAQDSILSIPGRVAGLKPARKIQVYDDLCLSWQTSDSSAGW